MQQKDTFIKYYKDQEGDYFKFFVNGKLLVKNTTVKDKEAGIQKISDAFDLNVNDGDKLELTVGTATNLEGAVTLSKYNTPTGKFEKSTVQAPAAIMGDNAAMMWFNMGKELGYAAGKNDAEREHLRNQLEGDGGKKGIDIAVLTENLSGTEIGQNILAGIMKKMGMLD